MIEFRLPDVGEGLEEAEVMRWLVAPGDRVVRDQPIVEIQTDKALVEIPAPAAGTVSRLEAEVGAIVKVGELLFVLDVPGDVAGAGKGASTADPGGAEARKAQAEAVDGAPSETAITGGPRRIRPRASPAVRKLAIELGVDLATVIGGGPQGRVLAEDLRRAMEDRAAGRPTAAPTDELAARRAVAAAARGDAPAAEVPPAATPLPSSSLPRELGQAAPGRIPITGVRRIIVRTMTQSWTTIPHIHGSDEIDALPLVDALRGLRRRASQRGMSESIAPAGSLRSGDPDPPRRSSRAGGAAQSAGSVAVQREVNDLMGSAAPEHVAALTLAVFFVLAAARALRRFPLVNASIDVEAQEIIVHEEVNVGLAVATPAGLIVPVIRGADRRSLQDLAAEIDRLARAARERKVRPDDLRGGTFTVTNFGSLGGRFANPIIRPPEVGILGFGAIRERPWVVGGAKIEARPVLPISFGADHRVIDGDLSVAFQEHVRDLLSDPVYLVLGE